MIPLVVILFSSVSLAQPVLQDPCDLTVLPHQAQRVLKQEFSKWKVLTFADLTDVEQKLWLKDNNHEKCPGIAVGHFEEQANLSYALFLIPHERMKPGSRFVVMSKRKKGGFEVSILFQTDNPTSYNVVSRVPPGKYSDSQKTESVLLSLDGILLRQFEVGATLFYWKNGRYRQLILSE